MYTTKITLNNITPVNYCRSWSENISVYAELYKLYIRDGTIVTKDSVREIIIVQWNYKTHTHLATTDEGI